MAGSGSAGNIETSLQSTDQLSSYVGAVTTGSINVGAPVSGEKLGNKLLIGIGVAVVVALVLRAYKRKT